MGQENASLEREVSDARVLAEMRIKPGYASLAVLADLSIETMKVCPSHPDCWTNELFLQAVARYAAIVSYLRSEQTKGQQPQE